MVHFDYDPNLFCSGNRAKQTIRITFGMWHYRKVMEVVLYSNISGLDAIRYAVEKILEELPPIPNRHPDDQFGRIVLEAADGDTLICDDDEGEWEEWLKKMVVSAEIIDAKPGGRIFDSIPTSEVPA
jgi:hypothetical protein